MRQLKAGQSQFERRDFNLLLCLTPWFALLTPGCATNPYDVTVPRSTPLGDAALSVQVTARKSIVGFISPRGRYADKLGPVLHNRLIDNGFVLKEKTADLHLHVQVYEVTTGATAREVQCDLLVELYPQWPGNLSEKKAYPPKEKPVFSMMVRVSEHKTNNGYPREQLTERAAAACLDDVVAYLVRSKKQAMT